MQRVQPLPSSYHSVRRPLELAFSAPSISCIRARPGLPSPGLHACTGPSLFSRGTSYRSHPLSTFRSRSPWQRRLFLLLPLPPTLPANFSNVSFLTPVRLRPNSESFCSPQVPPPNLHLPFIHLFSAHRCYHSEKGHYFLVIFSCESWDSRDHGPACILSSETASASALSISQPEAGTSKPFRYFRIPSPSLNISSSCPLISITSPWPSLDPLTSAIHAPLNATVISHPVSPSINLYSV